MFGADSVCSPQCSQASMPALMHPISDALRSVRRLQIQRCTSSDLRVVAGCRDVYAIGSSGGACVAGLLFVPECNLDEMVEFIGQCCDDCRLRLANRFKVRHYVKQAVLKFCPPDIATRVWDKLEVSVTQLFTCRNIRWKNFGSKVRNTGPSTQCSQGADTHSDASAPDTTAVHVSSGVSLACQRTHCHPPTAIIPGLVPKTRQPAACLSPSGTQHIMGKCGKSSMQALHPQSQHGNSHRAPQCTCIRPSGTAPAVCLPVHRRIPSAPQR